MEIPIQRMLRLREVAQGRDDSEVVWLCEYALRLTSVAVTAAEHLVRLASPEFVACGDLIRALREEPPIPKKKVTR